MNVLDHLGIYVQDLTESIQFYETLFGFTEHSRLNDQGIKTVHINMCTSTSAAKTEQHTRNTVTRQIQPLRRLHNQLR